MKNIISRFSYISDNAVCCVCQTKNDFIITLKDSSANKLECKNCGAVYKENTYDNNFKLITSTC
ncbi:MAG: hypothetical protein ACOCVF_01305 [bacterium]